MSFYRDTVRTARKEHKCELCGAIVRKGEKYHDKAGNEFGDVVCSKECEKCQSVIDEYFNSNSNYRDEGYCADWLRDWWRDYKCDDCKHIQQVDNGNGNPEYSRCDEMTHYCRCENFEAQDAESAK